MFRKPIVARNVLLGLALSASFVVAETIKMENEDKLRLRDVQVARLAFEKEQARVLSLIMQTEDGRKLSVFGAKVQELKTTEENLLKELRKKYQTEDKAFELNNKLDFAKPEDK